MKSFKVEYFIGGIVLLALLSGLGLFLFGMPDKPNGNSKEISFGEGEYEKFKYKEIVKPSGFVNSEPFELKDYVGKKVILLDILTYSCINCQRTFPYLRDWYSKYEDDGLIIIGIHTPEFAFEKKIENVQEQMKKFGLEFPIVLDNDYATWNAYGNKYWPRKYLIDIHGDVVYDHIGEGEYDITEKKIQELLQERKEFLGEDITIDSSVSEFDSQRGDIRSPEVYFGAFRNRDYLANGKGGVEGNQVFERPENILENKLYLDGTWNITKESAVNTKVGDSIIFRFYADKVNIVAESKNGALIKIKQDGKEIQKMTVDEATLYNVIDNEKSGEHLLEIIIEEGVLDVFTFTFG